MEGTELAMGHVARHHGEHHSTLLSGVQVVPRTATGRGWPLGGPCLESGR